MVTTLKKLSDLFDVNSGSKLDLNKMKTLPRSRGGINFVGRSNQNHGISATVAQIHDVEPFGSGLITVALGGTFLSSFVQLRPFYTAQNVAVLKPKCDMTLAEKVFICLCIWHNRFRYSAFGREANRTLRDLLIPEPAEFPQWVNQTALGATEVDTAQDGSTALPLDIAAWKEFRIDALFDIRKGKRLTKAHMTPGSTPFIGAIHHNNGLTAFIGQQAIHVGNTISVPYNGNGGVAEAFYQPEPFWCTDDVNVLYPKFSLTPQIGLFIATLIRLERYRFNYGRKWHLDRMRASILRLPVTNNGEPDWAFMERYINSLPYSSQVPPVSPMSSLSPQIVGIPEEPARQETPVAAIRKHRDEIIQLPLLSATDSGA